MAYDSPAAITSRRIRGGRVMRGFRTIVLVAALAGGTVLSLLRSLGGGNGSERKTRAGTNQLLGINLKRWLWSAAVLLMIAGLGGMLVVLAGLVPIKASSRHWTITAWFLNFTMERSVATHSLTVKTPALDDPGLLAQGATHYEFGCRPCHGAPESPQPVIAQQMTPAPPHLPWVVGEWRERELFYIVKHGVKFTGMPAWPSQQRDDEIWAMVAFLRQLPQLTPEGYQQLARGKPGNTAGIDELSAVPDKLRVHVESCARCHGIDGRGRGLGTFPVIAGQRAVYLRESLLAYARRERQSGIMQPVAAALPNETMSELARYYADLPDGLGTEGNREIESRASDSARNSAIERGREIATRGVPGRRLPACAACHGPGPASRNPIYPQLAGQHPQYIVTQLKLLQTGSRGGTRYAHIMTSIAGRLQPEQINDVAQYYSSLTPGAKKPNP
jgi:cytochrome c553